jgi:hypothetical protein
MIKYTFILLNMLRLYFWYVLRWYVRHIIYLNIINPSQIPEVVYLFLFSSPPPHQGSSS